MKYSAGEPLAMILPIPTPPNAPEDSVKFINMKEYPNFFDDLYASIGAWRTKGFRGRGLSKGFDDDSFELLEVHDVGDFEASFVPTLGDFKRLDRRFKLPDGTFEQIPQYENYGFAVFKLKAASDKEPHPMAFHFPTRDKEKLFFPTVHIHDMKVHDYEHFDHSIYFQASGINRDALGKRINDTRKPVEKKADGRRTFGLSTDVEVSDGPLKNHMKVEKAQGVIDPNEIVHALKMSGQFKNEDLFVN